MFLEAFERLISLSKPLMWFKFSRCIPSFFVNENTPLFWRFELFRMSPYWFLYVGALLYIFLLFTRVVYGRVPRMLLTSGLSRVVLMLFSSRCCAVRLDTGISLSFRIRYASVLY